MQQVTAFRATSVEFKLLVHEQHNFFFFNAFCSDLIQLGGSLQILKFICL